MRGLPIYPPTWFETLLWSFAALIAFCLWCLKPYGNRDWRFAAAAIGFAITASAAGIDWRCGYNKWDALALVGYRFQNYNVETWNLRLVGLLIFAATLLPYLWRNRKFEFAWLRFYITGRAPERAEERSDKEKVDAGAKRHEEHE